LDLLGGFMKKLIIALLVLILPCLVFAEWSAPVWTDDCTITIEKDKDGRITKWTEICCGEDAKQTRKREDTYTYYETGEVKDIIQKVYDSKDAVTSDMTVKHWVDGGQPTVEDNTGIGGEVPK